MSPYIQLLFLSRLGMLADRCSFAGRWADGTAKLSLMVAIGLPIAFLNLAEFHAVVDARVGFLLAILSLCFVGIGLEKLTQIFYQAKDIRLIQFKVVMDMEQWMPSSTKKSNTKPLMRRGRTVVFEFSGDL